MSASKIPDALAAADAFLSYLIDGRIPPGRDAAEEIGALAGMAIGRTAIVGGSAQPSMSPKHLRDLIELRDLVQAARAPASTVQGDTIEQRAASLEFLLTAAHKHGAQLERARVQLRDRCFAGVPVDDVTHGMIRRFDEMVRRGEDVPS